MRRSPTDSKARRPWRYRYWLWVLLVAVGSRATFADERAKVLAIGKGGQPLTSTTEIQLEGTDLQEAGGVAVGLELDVGAMLSSQVDVLTLELRCPDGTMIGFSGQFQVVVLPFDADSGCGVDLRAGQADVVTSSRTRVRTRLVDLSSTGTRYAARWTPEHEDSAVGDVVVLVFDGTVQAEAERPLEALLAGRALELESRSLVRDRDITDKEFAEWAGLYARFDAVKALAAGVRRVDVLALERAHAAVLASPNDIEARRRLAGLLTRYGLTEEAAYQTNWIESHQKVEADRERAPLAVPPADGARHTPSDCPTLFADAVASEPMVKNLGPIFVFNEQQRAAGIRLTSTQLYITAAANELAAIVNDHETSGAGADALAALAAHDEDGLLSPAQVALCRCFVDGVSVRK